MRGSLNSLSTSGALGFEECEFFLFDLDGFEVDGGVVEVNFVSTASGFFLPDEVSFEDLLAVNCDEKFFFGGKLHILNLPNIDLKIKGKRRWSAMMPGVLRKIDMKLDFLSLRLRIILLTTVLRLSRRRVIF
jgi:hypothetical protein